MTIIRSIVSLARGLGLAVVAEGVETEAQATMTREAGCEELQGYLFSRPLDAIAAEAYLHMQREASKVSGARKIGAARSRNGHADLTAS